MSAPQPANSTRSGELGGTESHGSLVPLLPSGLPAPSRSSKSSSERELLENSTDADDQTEGHTKTRRRDFWKLGKKSEDDKSKDKGKTTTAPKLSASQIAPVSALRPASPLRSAQASRASASPQRHPYAIPTSPSQGMYSSSPRLHSPASSQIFERNVQEDVCPPQASPHIPSHVITENHIPPALDASSAAITNEQLDPDSVEIVTAAIHQPAAVTVTGASAEQLLSSSLHEDWLHGHRHEPSEDTASNYGALDTADVRRLSFISFADVVNAEHAEHDAGGDHLQRRDSAHVAGLSTPPGFAAPRSPSPIRSPVSSHGLGTSPPTSLSASLRGLETSPTRGLRGPGSPLPLQSPPLGGELNIETMRQALRKTGSGDLSGARSQPMSAIGNDDGTFADRPFK